MGDLELQMFANRLKELRLSLNMTQSQFVKNLGITASALSAYEKNLKNPSIGIAKKIAEEYNVSIDWLCGLSDKMHIDSNLSTIGDIAKLLFQLDEGVDIDINLNINSFDGIMPEYTECNSIVFFDKRICDFLNEWQKMKTIHDSNTIDDELYSLWVEKTLKKYSTMKVEK